MRPFLASLAGRIAIGRIAGPSRLARCEKGNLFSTRSQPEPQLWSHEQLDAFIAERQQMWGQLTRILPQHSRDISTTTTPLPFPISVLASNSLKANAVNEDAFSYFAFQHSLSRDGGESHPSGPPLIVITVADGHGGPLLSKLVANHLPRYVARAIRPLIYGLWNPERNTLPVSDTAESIRRAFLELDTDLISGALPELHHPDVVRQGSCAVVAVIRGEQVWIANVGDCGAVMGVWTENDEEHLARQSGSESESVMNSVSLHAPASLGQLKNIAKEFHQNASPPPRRGRRRPRADHTSSAANASPPSGQLPTFLPLPLSSPHTLVDPRELSNLLSRHPTSLWPSLTRGGRVAGVLVPSRAFGDAELKWVGEAGQWLSSSLTPDLAEGISEAKPPYVVADPEVVYYGPDVPDDDVGAHKQDCGPNTGNSDNYVPHFLVIATDGIWDTVSTSNAVSLVSSVISNPASSVNPATLLIGASLGETHAARCAAAIHPIPRSVRDDATAVVIGLNMPSAKGAVWGIPTNTDWREKAAGVSTMGLQGAKMDLYGTIHPPLDAHGGDGSTGARNGLLVDHKDLGVERPFGSALGSAESPFISENLEWVAVPKVRARLGEWVTEAKEVRAKETKRVEDRGGWSRMRARDKGGRWG
ncbi:[Pyruvate dehydrogenase [acetyl-transferring]]-phosphatase 1, mitochondrial [Gonapodya sp. JEL0774]|nr:[Pyruvate dehydrogenase [acetyl-transferring]]-phosphatase 1, mitochondrial [Gonapodya sp. JEL0774]